jgi:hypothetical protein
MSEQGLTKDLNPVRKCFSKDELFTAALRFMREQGGRPAEMSSEERNRWHTDLGLITAFVVVELWGEK